jgi:nucleoredoxin
VAVLGCLLAAVPAPADVSQGLKDLFDTGLIGADGISVGLDVLEDKVVGIYFSAHWCGPCRKFTPDLVKYHDRYGDDFEIVFVSSDRSKKAQFEYMESAGMAWPAVRYDSETVKALKSMYQVSGIPTLVMVNGEGETITREGRRMVINDVPADKIKGAKVVREPYTCENCSKTHYREKVVLPGEDE